MLVKSQLNSIETLVSQALVDTKIINEEFDTIMKEKKKTRKDERKCEEFKWKTRKYETE